MKSPEIYADYHNVDDENRVRLTSVGTRRDLTKHGLELRDGLAVTIYMDDGDDAGNRDDLMADAIVRYNAKESCWVAEIDWSRVKNRSERKKAIIHRPTKKYEVFYSHAILNRLTSKATGASTRKASLPSDSLEKLHRQLCRRPLQLAEGKPQRGSGQIQYRGRVADLSVRYVVDQSKHVVRVLQISD
jgi:mRNA-degrading endonuclease RelE of RelBE toxin-antitoxin system